MLYLCSMQTTESKTAKQFDLIIFGGDGDLAFRKIYPALYYRIEGGQIDKTSRILVVTQKKRTQDSFIELLESHLKKHVKSIDKAVLNKLIKLTQHACNNIKTGYKDAELDDWFKNATNKVRAFYLATPASAFGAISKFLYESGYVTKDSRVVLEKPLGVDLESSEEVNNEVAKYFTEKQIYRIDHYLGKETVQNLMVLRFANNIFEGSWNAREIDNVQITVAESLGVGSRGAFYDKYGALRDMVQNHLLQLVCLTAMEPPAVLNANEVRDEKLKVLKALRLFDSDSIKTDTIRGQYTRGSSSEGHLPSYLEEIDKYESDTETYVALKTYVDNWRWSGVPFYLRTAKRLPHRYSEIVINFKNVPHNIFPQKKNIENNRLTIRLQPEERIELRQMVKIPGPGGYRYQPFSLELDYADHFNERFPEAYERLLMDVVRGNQTLFMRRDEVKASWKWIESILHHWKTEDIPNQLYEAGTWGPGDSIMDADNSWVESEHVVRKKKKNKNLEK